ncbi:MAG: Teichoic acids export ATP-binding protein TagH [Candidatus Omnitrophica bacterium ADurb.Bin277]|nr:MAG: Teichoic acids export ATP-binding protein TagH [Candidatus Omnitrophica bacterium ADurb.Bin277]
MNAITIQNLWEKYRVKFVEAGKVSWEEVWALQDLSLTVAKGEVVGVIGENGAGKTTLLRLIAGMLMPDKGSLDVNGRVSALMELGAGFDHEFTGRENIVLNAGVYGISENSLNEKINKIVEFSGLGRFINAPIKYYSQGMYMRLAFALAIFSDPDILLIDDILAVGDQDAQQKCIKKVFELKDAGKTILVVSHDMNMVKKLCDRVVLLEKGKKTAAGDPEAVIPHYIETCGNKKGICVLENPHARIVFNNGRLFLNQGGNLISHGNGGYVVLSPHEGCKVSSANLSWEVELLKKEEAAATGKDAGGKVLQAWRMSLRGRELDLAFETEEKGAKEFYMDMPFPSEYSKCKTLNKEIVFPNFTGDREEILNLENDLSVLGLMPKEEKKGLPFLFFKAERKDCLFKIHNTGFDTASRVVQTHFLAKTSTLTIRFLKAKEEFEDIFHNIKPVRIGESPGQDAARLSSKETKPSEKFLASHSIGSDHVRLFIDTNHRAIRLYFKGQEVSGSRGAFHSVLPFEHCISMEVKKKDEKNISLILYYDAFVEPMDLYQIYEFSISETNSVDIKVTVKNSKKIKMKDRSFRMELNAPFREWQTRYEKNGFEGAGPEKMFSAVRMKENKISKILLGSKQGSVFSNLAFETCQKTDRSILTVFEKAAPEETSETCVQFSPIVFYDQVYFAPGEHVYFHGKVTFDAEPYFDRDAAGDREYEIASTDRRFVFSRGKSKLCLGPKELTCGLGVFTSIRSSNVWFDSYQAAWDLIEKADNKIRVVGHWTHIPVSQSWSFFFKSKKTLHWKVVMEVYEKCNLEIHQANLMLSSDFRRWSSSGGAKGKFTGDYTAQYDILPFRFWYGKDSEIEACGNGFLRVKFRSKNRPEMRGVIENTDQLYCGRLLQFQREQNQIMLPGKYDYFEGEIEIEA